MSLPVVLHPAAEEDWRSIRAELEAARPGAGLQFSRRVQELLERLERMPESHGVVWRHVRAARIARFQYVLCYVVTADRVFAIAIQHGARKPSTWRSRLAP